MEAEMGHPKTLIELMQLHPTEDECRQAIFEHRWPHGFSCRRCGHERAWYLQGRGLYECASCHFQSSLAAGKAEGKRPLTDTFRRTQRDMIT
jgi:hypothetical protein